MGVWRRVPVSARSSREPTVDSRQPAAQKVAGSTMQSESQTAAREMRVLLAAVSARPGGHRKALEEFAAEGCDWASVLQLADKHGLGPLAAWLISETLSDSLPAEVLSLLRQRVQQSAGRNLTAVVELRRIFGADPKGTDHDLLHLARHGLLGQLVAQRPDRGLTDRDQRLARALAARRVAQHLHQHRHQAGVGDTGRRPERGAAHGGLGIVEQLPQGPVCPRSEGLQGSGGFGPLGLVGGHQQLGELRPAFDAALGMHVDMVEMCDFKKRVDAVMSAAPTGAGAAPGSPASCVRAAARTVASGCDTNPETARANSSECSPASCSSAAWAAVARVLKTHRRVRPYKAGSWGPKEADALIAADGGWHNPVLGEEPA